MKNYVIQVAAVIPFVMEIHIVPRNSYFLHWNFDWKSCFVVFSLQWNEWKNQQFNFSSQNLSIECNFSNVMEKKPRYYAYFSIEFGHLSKATSFRSQSQTINMFQHFKKNSLYQKWHFTWGRPTHNTSSKHL